MTEFVPQITKRWTDFLIHCGSIDSLPYGKKIEPFPILYTKINSRWFNELNVKDKTRTFLENNIEYF